MLKLLRRLTFWAKDKKSPEKLTPSEDLELTILQEAPIPIFLCAKDGFIIEQNRRAYHFFGFTKGKFLTSLFPGLVVKPYTHGLTSIRLMDKQYFFTYYMEGFNPVVVYLVDKTELQSLKEEYRFSISYLSHELKTPLAVAKTKAETLLQSLKQAGVPLDTFNELFELNERLSQLSTLIKRLFQMSSTLIKELSLSKSEVKLSDLLSDLRFLAEGLAQEKKIELVFSLTEDLRLSIDPELFLQALFNLVENAIKFSPEGTRVTLMVEKNQEKLRLRVLDEGPGVPEEELPLLTKPFYRAKVLGKGLGLGLYLVERIVEAHGGELKLANLPKPGSGFAAEIILNLFNYP